MRSWAFKPFQGIQVREEDAISGQFGIRTSDSKICQQLNETLKFVNSSEFVNYYHKSCSILS